MTYYESQCVGCPPDLGCDGPKCPNYAVLMMECDQCHDDVDDLYELDGQELCEICFRTVVTAEDLLEDDEIQELLDEHRISE